MRKIRQRYLRYVFTAATTAMTVVAFIRFIGFVNPFLAPIVTADVLENQLKQAAIEANRICPQTVDNETRLDSTNSAQAKTFSYYYTLVNKTKREFDVAEVKKWLAPQVVRNVRNSEQMKFMRNNLVTLVFNYFDKNGAKLLDIRVTPDDYK